MNQATLEQWKQDILHKRWTYIATFFFASYILVWFAGDTLSTSLLAAKEGAVFVAVDDFLPGVPIKRRPVVEDSDNNDISADETGEGINRLDKSKRAATMEDDFAEARDDKRKRLPLKFTRPPLTNLVPLGEDDAEGRTMKPRKTRVCTVALNPRQGSIFRTNLMALYGSGRYTYVVKRECPWQMPRVRLIAYVKCCVSPARVHSTINFAIQTDDVVVLTGDEYCLINDARPHFRQYYGAQVISKASSRWSVGRSRSLPAKRTDHRDGLT